MSSVLKLLLCVHMGLDDASPWYLLLKGQGQKEGLAQHMDDSVPSGGFHHHIWAVGSQAACTQTTTRLEKQTSECESIAS